MPPQQIVGIGVRLFSLWLAMSSIRYFIAIPEALSNAKIDDSAAYSIAAGALQIAIAIFLWLFPMWTSHKIVPRTRFENHINLQPLEAARVGCALMGLWLFSNVIPNLVWFLLRSLIFVSSQPAIETLDAEGRLNVFVSFFEAIFSLVLVFRSADFAKLAVRSETKHETDRAL